ncbi:hypothetical protein [uncultured Devosia sp.]|uniref:hypothetical protein n=1 Tax=uncultured Devosia sp. TaxID=211434 RepID=UPI0026120546|nr:hypothetical protein [uncultured Devosia sp.]
MQHNSKVEIERVNGKYVSQIEVSSIGRAGRKRLVADTFHEALKQVAGAHDELLGHVETFHKASQPAPVPVADENPKATAKDGNVRPHLVPKANKPGKKRNEQARKFASE